MADLFGDPSLFEEFDKEQLPCDKILRQTFKKDVGVLPNTSIDEGSDSAFSAEFQVGSDSGSDSESENDFIENEDSDHGGGITGVGEILHQINIDSKLIGKDMTQGKGSVDSERYLRVKQQMEELIEENMKLKKQARLLSCERVPDLDGPSVQCIFLNHDIARKYKTDIEDFVQNLVENDRNESIPKLYMRPNCVRLKDTLKDDDSYTVISSSHFYKHYIVDAMGWPLVCGSPALTDGWHVPMYEQVYSDSLPVEDNEDDGSKPQPRQQRKRGSCFNCDGDHSMRDCKEPHDQAKINQARREMAENSGPKKQRYIQDEDSVDQSSKFQAGRISKELREAMGINSRQLPRYIYQMRILGYPPGWLAEAEVSTSGVAMFDKHGREVAADGDSLEDGEVDVNGPSKQLYDKEKLVSYPGFNVQPEDDVLDEHEEFGMPAMQPHHNKEALALFLTPNSSQDSGTKRKHRNDADAGSSSSKKGRYAADSQDMDLEDSMEPPSRGSQNSPTMDSLKAQHQLIQAQLELMGDGGSDSEVQILDSCCEEDGEIKDRSFIPPIPMTPEAPPLPPGTPPVTPQTPANPASTSVSFKSPLTPNQVTPSRIPLPPAESAQEVTANGRKIDDNNDLLTTPECSHSRLLRTPSSSGSLSSTFGTPVVLAKTPTSAGADSKGLPEASKFAAGIMEHLPFENLPDSTGKYQQMKQVLQSVRSNRKKL